MIEFPEFQYFPVPYINIMSLFCIFTRALPPMNPTIRNTKEIINGLWGVKIVNL